MVKYIYLYIMRPKKVNQKKLLKGLLNVFRTKGYDGASLNDLAASSGLQKASLYHRFPEGKKEIAASVINFVDENIQKKIYEVLTDTSVSVAIRVEKVLKNIDLFYEGGEAGCILRSMTLDTGIHFFENEIKGCMQKWIDAFYFLGKEIGYTETKALQYAEETLMLVQGSLLVSKGIGSLTPFNKALKKIEYLYRV